jgi:hypothetical protein
VSFARRAPRALRRGYSGRVTSPVGAASAYPFPTVRLTALGVAAGTITSLLATWSALSAAQQQILGAQWEAMDNADFLVSIGG